MTVDPTAPSQSAETADYAFWDSQSDVSHGTKYVRHVQMDEPLEIVVDGQVRQRLPQSPHISAHISPLHTFSHLCTELPSACSRGMVSSCAPDVPLRYTCLRCAISADLPASPHISRSPHISIARPSRNSQVGAFMQMQQDQNSSGSA